MLTVSDGARAAWSKLSEATRQDVLAESKAKGPIFRRLGGLCLVIDAAGGTVMTEKEYCNQRCKARGIIIP